MAVSRPPRITGSESRLFSTALANAVEQATFTMSTNIRSMVTEATGDTYRGATPFFRAVSESVTKSVQSRTEFRLANERLAEHAQQAVLESYEEEVEGRKEVGSYRIGDNRLSGGLLRNALTRRGMFVGTFEGIAFGNEDILDNEAGHWARLNYGAGSGRNLTPVSTTLRIGSRSVGITTLKGPTSNEGTKAFRLPVGYWTSGEFYPLGKRKVGKLLAVQARRFLDAGVHAIADNIDEVYFDLVADLLDKAARESRGAGMKITVTPQQLGLR